MIKEKELNSKKFSIKKGMSLIELIITIFIMLIIIGCLFSMVKLSFTSLNDMKFYSKEYNDKIYFINLLENDISSANLILKNENKDSLGFSIMNFKNNRKFKYYYIFYKYNNITKEISRCAFKTNQDFSKKTILRGNFGTNKILNNIKSVRCFFDGNVINLKIILKYIDKEFKIEKIFANRTNIYE